MRPGFSVRLVALLLALSPYAIPSQSSAQPSTRVSITWEVKNRFRLFKNEDDFQYMARFHSGGGVLAAETALAADTHGNGWARRVVTHLCVDDDGQLQEVCSREYSGQDASDHESIREAYLAPTDHRIGVKAAGAAEGTVCTWKFLTDDKDSTAVVKRDQPCGDEVFHRAAYGKTTQIQLYVASQPEYSQPTATTSLKVRDILIAGLGDSTAAGEGDPDRPVQLAEHDGFCFRRFLSPESAAYFRPSRAGYSGDRECGNDADDRPNWRSEERRVGKEC